MHRVEWSAAAHEDVSALFDYVAEHDSLWAEFPRLYEAAPEYGEGVRRISLAGQHVLYEVDDQEQIVRVLAVVGQRQNPRRIKGEP